MSKESCKGSNINLLQIPWFFNVYLLINYYYFSQIEAASKYSTVDTLKQQYRFVPAKYKVCILVLEYNSISSSLT